MDSAQLAIDSISRFLHVGTAIVLVGGTVFMRFVLMPVASQLPTDAHDQLRAGLLARWKRFVHGGIGLFILSGIYNYMRLMPSHKGDKLWHALAGSKIMLAFLMFFFVSALVGKSKAFEGMRQQRAKWMLIVIVMAVIVVAISSFLKVRGIVPVAI